MVGCTYLPYLGPEEVRASEDWIGHSRRRRRVSYLLTYLLTWIQSSVTDKQQLLLLTRDTINHNHRNQAAKSGSSVARHHHHHDRRRHAPSGIGIKTKEPTGSRAIAF